MKSNKTGIALKTVALVENNSYLAGLLAALCLLFAINFFLTGPGSDGGSGLGGTGKFGGESGLGGTGKAPDPGSAFKLGAADSDTEDNYTDFLSPDYDAVNPVSLPEERPAEAALLAAAQAFDVNSLRLSLSDEFKAEAQAIPQVVTLDNIKESNLEVAALVQAVTLPQAGVNDDVYAAQLQEITADALVSSFDILNSLMLAEAQTSLEIAARENLDATQVQIRNRLSIPVRPERPDRFTVPARITPVQRVNIPAAPPVRPMRTLSTLQLGR